MARGLQAIQILALLGIAVSCYALYVEHKTAAASVMGQEYEALCDIKWLGVSCSKVFKSKYGKMLSLFGIIPKGHVLDQPNAALGIIFYGCAFILPFLRKIPLGLRVTIMLAASAPPPPLAKGGNPTADGNAQDDKKVPPAPSLKP